MSEKIISFFSLKTAKILIIVSLSFFTYIFMNIVSSYFASFILNGDANERIHIYSQLSLCNRNYSATSVSVFTHRFIYKVSLFIVIKALLIHISTYIKNFSTTKDWYIKSILHTIIMTDFVYVILILLFSKWIDWNAYFNSSYIIGNGLYLFIPSWIFVGVSGILNLKIFNKNFGELKTLMKYLLFAFSSFLLQLGIIYIAFGRVFHKL